MNPLKPYLIRAVYEWIIDCDLTPYLQVNAEWPNTIIAQQFVDNGIIILNIRPQAIQGLSLGNELISFSARFSGKPMHISVPIQAVLAIYAQENGKGMVFDPSNEETPPPPENKPTGKPTLRVVK